jgi:hypothetical protein
MPLEARYFSRHPHLSEYLQDDSIGGVMVLEATNTFYSGRNDYEEPAELPC